MSILAICFSIRHQCRALIAGLKNAIYDNDCQSQLKINICFILRILLYAVAAASIIANLWMLSGPTCPSLPSALELSSNVTERFHSNIHMISITTLPLPDLALVSIDSIARHMPYATVNLHITVEENIPSATADERKGVLARQIQFFKSKGLDINLIFHDDVKSDLKGTLLEAVNITQRHVGGYYGVKPHGYFAPHVADLYRVLIMLKHGGIYMDYNYVLLRDLHPLFHMYGPNLLVTDHYNVTIAQCGIGLAAGWFALTPHHVLMEKMLIRLAEDIKKQGPNFVYPYDNSPSFGINYNWAKYDGYDLTLASRGQCRSSRPPITVNEIPEVIGELSSGVHGDSFLKKFPWDYYRYRNESYAIISRKYLMPTHWNRTVVNFFTEHTRAVFNDIEELPKFNMKVRMLQAAYQLHIFGYKLKYEWLEFAENRTQYPLLQYLNEKTCKHLCDVKTLRGIVEGEKSLMMITNLRISPNFKNVENVILRMLRT